MQQWLAPFQSAWDLAGFALFVLVFPVYHAVYPWVAARRPERTARGVIDALRRSWIERLLVSGDVTTAAQLTRNLTMVNSILVSSALLLLGLSGNLLVQLPRLEGTPHPTSWDLHPDALRVKIYLLVVVFAAAFSFFMTSLRHLGHFVMIIGADPALVESHYGSPADYFAELINRASHRYTLGVRSFYASLPLLAWLFDARLFFVLNAFWAFKFIRFQDFAARRVRARDPAGT